MRQSTIKRLACLAIATMSAGVLLAGSADARVGGGRSVGSRGGSTFSAPPTTNTAPKPAAPIERSMTQPGKQTSAAAQSAQAGKAAAAAQPSRFGGLMKGLLLGGLLGAGLAAIFGAGAFASVLGFLLQTALIAGLIYLAVSFFRNRMGGQPAMAGAGAGAAPGNRDAQNASYRVGMPAGGAGRSLTIGPDDYNAFERLLGEIQNAYGRQDINALGNRVTPEMLSYFAEDLSDNDKNGLRNEVTMGKLLQGDLAEAWREDGTEYATVAMRYSITDATVEKTSGKVVKGSRTAPEEVTEIWTFRRPLNGKPQQWELSAIQQTG